MELTWEEREEIASHLRRLVVVGSSHIGAYDRAHDVAYAFLQFLKGADRDLVGEVVEWMVEHCAALQAMIAADRLDRAREQVNLAQRPDLAERIWNAELTVEQAVELGTMEVAGDGGC